MTDSVTRYVPTYIAKSGLRTMLGACQGRNTHETREEAEAYMAAVHGGQNDIAGCFGEQAVGTFEVRPVECYPGHFDPKSIYFD